MLELIQYLRWAVLNKETLDLSERAKVAEILDRYAVELETKEKFHNES